MSLIKVAWYMVRVKNMHSGSSSDPWGPCSKQKLRSMHYDISWVEANLRLAKLTSVFHHLPNVGPKQFCALAKQVLPSVLPTHEPDFFTKCNNYNTKVCDIFWASLDFCGSVFESAICEETGIFPTWHVFPFSPNEPIIYLLIFQYKQLKDR